MNELKNQIEKIKENDPKNINKQGIVNLDAFISHILNIYAKLIERAKIVAESTFYSADLNRNGIIDCYEFVLLYRYIESNIICYI